MLLGHERDSHYSDVKMSAMAFQITSLTIVYSTVYSGADQRKHQSSASLAFVRGIHRWPVNSQHKGPVTWKMFPFDDVIMIPEESVTCWQVNIFSGNDVSITDWWWTSNGGISNIFQGVDMFKKLNRGIIELTTLTITWYLAEKKCLDFLNSF